jgi:hypothetical protein
MLAPNSSDANFHRQAAKNAFSIPLALSYVQVKDLAVFASCGGLDAHAFQNLLVRRKKLLR